MKNFSFCKTLRPRRLRLESLEARVLFAGNVVTRTYPGQPGMLFFYGDDLSNNFEINPAGNNMMYVRPLDSTTKINGGRAVYMPIPEKGINVNLFGGDDQMNMVGVAFGNRQIWISTGAGVDSVYIQSTKADFLSVGLESGRSFSSEQVRLNNVDAREVSFAALETAWSDISIVNSRISGDARFRGGAGVNRVSLSSSTVGTINATMGSEAISSQPEEFVVNQTRITGDLNLDMGDGNSKVSLVNSQATNARVRLGNGARDTLLADGFWAEYADFDGGSGSSDSLTMRRNRINRLVTKGFEFS